MLYFLKRLYKIIKLKYYEIQYLNKNTEEVFNHIYKNQVWGKNDIKTFFYSGTGSHKKEIIEPYIKIISAFLQNKNYTVLDLGCGDFNIGKNFVNSTKNYIAVDIVKDLIDHNKLVYVQHDNLSFLKMDLTIDPIPKVDVILLRQVLMHLSNNEINNFLINLKNNLCKFLIITESLPINEFKPNLDKINGSFTRVVIDSGVVLDKEPFNLLYKNKTTLLEVIEFDSLIKTIVYEF